VHQGAKPATSYADHRTATQHRSDFTTDFMIFRPLIAEEYPRRLVDYLARMRPASAAADEEPQTDD